MSQCDQKMEQKTPDGQEIQKPIGKNYSLYGAAFTVNMVALTCGITFSWTSPMLLKLNGNRDPQLNPLMQAVTPFEECWILNALGLGAFVGPFFVAKLADTIGRKDALLIVAIPLLGSFFLLAFGTNVIYIYAGRFISGLSVGATFVLIPMFLGEIAEDSNRGQLGCFMSVFVSLGVLFSFIAGPYLSVKMFSLSCTLPVWIFLIFFRDFVPESPVYYMYKGNREKAEESLYRLRNKSHNALQAELVEIAEHIEKVTASDTSFRDMIKSNILVKGLTISIGLVLSQQLSGVGIVTGFMQSILDSTDDIIPSEISVIMIGIIQVLTTIVASSLVERAGRKILLLISSIGSCLSLISLGIYFLLKDYGVKVDSIFWLPMASLILYVIAVYIGLGPLPWAILGEIFPANVKAIATTLTISINYLFGFLIVIFFSYLTEYLSMAINFWMFAICCGFAFVFIYYFVVETKGKSLTEIQEMLSGKEK